MNIGDKFRFKNGQELLEVEEEGLRVNGGVYLLNGPSMGLENFLSSECEKIDDDEFYNLLDDFWNSGIPQGERVTFRTVTE